MTSPVALAVPAAAATSATMPAASGNASSSDAKRSDFSKPLQQARQQHLARQAVQSRQASQPPAPARATSPASTSSTAATHGDTRDHDKDDDTSKSTTSPDAAAAMLALLGQSIPATATPAPVASSPTAAADASITGATLQAATTQAANLQAGLLQGLPVATTSPPAQADDDDALDLSTSLSDATGKAAATLTDDGDTAPAGNADVTAMSKALASMTTSSNASSTSQDRKESLDALQAMLPSSAQLAQTQASVVATTPHALSMQASAGTPAFAQELGQQVAWLGGQDIKQARIRLHPEDLGELDVKVSVLHDHVDVSFVAQHPQAVHAVQQTLSQLDAMLAQHGLTLGQAQVGQGGRGGESGQSGTPGSAQGNDAGSAEGGEVASVVAPVLSAVGLLDTFA
ncbi:flagellar hook-length control protein FliK [Dyella sp. 20L07]|uniref:flagellar hook-length control protein FliK n=1 Tax=Dyella sp. 20L07 TaxID=3384240 RepID=UPI003D2B7CF5